MVVCVEPFGQFDRRAKFAAEARLDLFAKGLQAQVRDNILQSRALAVGTVTEFLVGPDDGGDDPFDLVVRDEGERIGQPRERGGVRVRATQPSADGHIEAAPDLGVLAGNEADVLGEDVHAVIVRMCDGDLELAR